MDYPAERLVPLPHYRHLAAEEVPGGWLARRVDEAPLRFDAEGFLDVGQIASPKRRTVDGLSVNLLGQFEVVDCCWKPATQEAAAKLYREWQPGEPAIPPAPGEMACLPTGTWDVFGLLVQGLHGRAFNTRRGIFTAKVIHAPNCWNFWHFEVRFYDDGGNDLKGKSQGVQEKAGEALRQAVQRAKLPRPVEEVGTPTPWPERLYAQPNA